jgi:hypothetical protein
MMNRNPVWTGDDPGQVEALIRDRVVGGAPWLDDRDPYWGPVYRFMRDRYKISAGNVLEFYELFQGIIDRVRRETALEYESALPESVRWKDDDE